MKLFSNRRAETIATIAAKEQCDALRTLSEAINNARLSELTEDRMNELADSSRFVQSVLELHRNYEKLYEKLGLITRTMAIDYSVDRETGQVPLNDENFNLFLNGLRLAAMEVMNLPVAGDTTATDLLKNRNELQAGLAWHNENSHHFLQMQNASKIIKLIDDFLQTVIESTNTGIILEVRRLQDRFEAYVTQTAEIKAQKMMSDAYSVELPEETARAWREVLIELDFGLALISSHMEKIFGPGACWLLSQIQIERLNSLMISIRKEKAGVEKQIGELRAVMNREPGLLQSLGKLISTRNSPPRDQMGLLSAQRDALNSQLLSVQKAKSIRGKMEEETALLSDAENEI